jgi:hypothetical protein
MAGLVFVSYSPSGYEFQPPVRSKEFLPGPWADRDAVGDRVAEQVIQRTGLRICAKPGLLEVAFDQAATLQRVSDACGDLRDQLLQLARLGSRHGMKHGGLRRRRSDTRRPWSGWACLGPRASSDCWGSLPSTESPHPAVSCISILSAAYVRRPNGSATSARRTVVSEILEKTVCSQSYLPTRRLLRVPKRPRRVSAG